MNLVSKWLTILRAYSWPASVTPMIIGGVVAYKSGQFNAYSFALTLIAGLLLHSAANLANTYFDYKNGVDKKGADDIGILEDLISPGNAIRLVFVLFSVSALIGIYLAVKNDLLSLIVVGVAGFALAWLYTANLAYKYRALGEIGIFLCFGPLIVTGTALIQTGRILPDAVIASIPAGLLVTGILFVNNMRDLKMDTETKIKTLPQILGEKNSLLFYYSLIAASYLVAVFFIGISVGLPLIALSVPPAIKLLKMAKNGEFSPLVRETAKFVGIFGTLFAFASYFA